MSDSIINEYLPDRVTHPGKTLADAIEEIGMTQSELADRTGRPKKTINEIIKGQTSIMPETAIQLERVLGVPASFWMSRQRHYDEAEAHAEERERLADHVDWIRNFPTSQMIKLGWLESGTSPIDKLEALLSFFAIGSPWNRPMSGKGLACKRFFEPLKPTKRAPMLFRHGYAAEKLRLQAFLVSLYRSRFQSTLHGIRSMTFNMPKGFDHKIQELCAGTGVAAVFVPLIKGVHAWGATRWLAPDRAILQLSLKGKYEDVFWFTFFHEAAHILLHGKKCVFVDSGPAAQNRQEEEADSWASEFLMPKSLWSTFLRGKSIFTESEVIAFARSVSIPPAIVVGRLQHERILPNTHLNGLRRKIQFSQEGKT